MQLHACVCANELMYETWLAKKTCIVGDRVCVETQNEIKRKASNTIRKPTHTDVLHTTLHGTDDEGRPQVSPECFIPAQGIVCARVLGSQVQGRAAYSTRHRQRINSIRDERQTLNTHRCYDRQAIGQYQTHKVAMTDNGQTPLCSHESSWQLCTTHTLHTLTMKTASLPPGGRLQLLGSWWVQCRCR